VLITQKPEIKEKVIDEHRSRFTIEPLEPGFGDTIGNSLRRTLLSSIPGAAVTSIKIDSVLHEFSTIEGVKEDVTELILNLKGLVVSSDFDEPATITLEATGKGSVTAGEIKVPAGVEIHNPNMHIATLSDKGRIAMEMTVERGRGYVSAEQNKQMDSEIGRIAIDSIYSPVLRVSYNVDDTRVEQRTDFDKLIIDVQTKENMTPRNAIASAGATLLALFGIIRELDKESEGIEIEEEEILDFSTSSDLQAPVSKLDLSTRSTHSLEREGINTIGELIKKTPKELESIKNFGAKSVSEVVEKLAEMNLSLKASDANYIVLG
jgi:DNA-directed RNA polymerase subunit alpha